MFEEKGEKMNEENLELEEIITEEESDLSEIAKIILAPTKVFEEKENLNEIISSQTELNDEEIRVLTLLESLLKKFESKGITLQFVKNLVYKYKLLKISYNRKSRSEAVHVLSRNIIQKIEERREL